MIKKAKHSVTSLEYGEYESPFGTCYIAFINKTIYAMGFYSLESDAFAFFRHHYPEITLIKNKKSSISLGEDIFHNHNNNINIQLNGTLFQKRVWLEVYKIPFGTTCYYQEIASKINSQNTTRAVANAIACNPIAFLIPCHRVIHKNGGIGGYRWGVYTKKALLNWEHTTILMNHNQDSPEAASSIIE